MTPYCRAFGYVFDNLLLIKFNNLVDGEAVVARARHEEERVEAERVQLFVGRKTFGRNAETKLIPISGQERRIQHSEA